MRHEREVVWVTCSFWGCGLFVSTYFGYEVFRENGKREQLMAYARWTSLMESVTYPRGPITQGLFSILILIGRQLQFFEKKKSYL